MGKGERVDRSRDEVGDGGRGGRPGGRASRLERRRARARGRALGLALVLAGSAMLGYVGWELWGTGISTARAQSQFRADIRAHGFPSRPIHGHALGYLRIPRIGLDMAFVQGIDQGALAKGPGHYPRTPLPGRGGNVAIAGHRTTHLAPFWSLNALQPGDLITLQTGLGTFVYRVQWVITVAPGNWSVTTRTPIPSLTLTTCNPRFSAGQRLVVRAVQVYGRAPGRFIDLLAHGSVPAPRNFAGRR